MTLVTMTIKKMEAATLMTVIMKTGDRHHHQLPESPILATKYAHQAELSTVYRKEFVCDIGIIIALLTLSTLDLLEVQGHLPFI